jgi:hypothetical protein
MPTVCDNVSLLHIRVNRMARRSVRRPKPKAPVLTVEQKRRRIERFKKCICDIEAFDPQNVQKRFGVPEVVTLEAAIDKALLSAFVHGTSAYMRYNRAATLYHGPLVKNAPVRSTVSQDSGEPGSQEARDAQEAQEARTYFSEGKKRSIDLLQKAICTLEDEIAEPLPVIAAPQNSNAPQTAGEVRTLLPSRGAFDLNAVWRRVHDGGEVAIHEPAHSLSHHRVFSCPGRRRRPCAGALPAAALAGFALLGVAFAGRAALATWLLHSLFVPLIQAS